MSSLVTEILSSAGKLENQELGTKVDELKEKIEGMKTNVQEYVQKRYVDFLPSSIKTTEMFNKLSAYDTEIMCLTNIFENEMKRKIDESADEFKEICNQLYAARSALNVVTNLIAIHDGLQESKSFFRDYRFLEAVKCIRKVAALIKELQDTWKDQIVIISSLNTEYSVQSEKLKYDMGEIWKDYFKWNISKPSESGGDNENDKQVIELSFRKSSSINLQDLVHAMQEVSYLQHNLKLFGKRLLDYVIQPIVTTDTVVNVKNEEERTVLKICLYKTAVQPVESVFNKLSIVFEFLTRHDFGQIKVSNSSGDENEEETLIRCLGNIIYKEFCEILVKKCLGPAVPSKREDFQAFDEIVNCTINFHNFLTGVGILPADEKTLISYARDVDTLIANKMCQTLLANARKLMLDDLHKSLKVGDNLNADDSSLRQQIKKESGVEEKPSVNIFSFPTCEISTSARDLLAMIDNIMEDATSCSSSCAVKLVTTVRNILILYCDIVSCYHKDSIETMPLYAALFHNNCMYIAHHIMTIGPMYNNRLPPPFSKDIVTFVDLVPKIREGGVEVFLAQMRAQKKNLISFLHQAGDFHNMATDDNFISKMEKAIKQCILHLEQLSKMWKNVLCSNIYLRSLGTLLNSVLEEIISQVTNMEDISATHAGQMIQIFEIITTRSNPLFQIDETQKPTIGVNRAVPKWDKFTELVLVLNSSLQIIVDRWSSGKGPLALVFTADEVKQMIRALFQNTDIRAAVLSKIK
ncbi:Centromere/kinetochore protein zw10 [Chamberlinius hualienensis]